MVVDGQGTCGLMVAGLVQLAKSTRSNRGAGPWPRRRQDRADRGRAGKLCEGQRLTVIGRHVGWKVGARRRSRSQWRIAMHFTMLLSVLAMSTLCAGSTLAQDLTGTLKKIKETGAITLGHRESSVPFSYYDDKQQVVGYAMDLCYKIVDGVKSNLKLAKLDAKLNPVTSATRIPLMANGTID